VTLTRSLSKEEIVAALRGVIDPELDESVVDLGFVDRVDVDGDSVEIGLRLPTFWCAPNFAYLMAYDARAAALQVPGVSDVRVVLKDHMYADEITSGVSCGESFDSVFDGQAADDNLADLRRLFADKAYGMRQEQLVRFLLETGLTPREIVTLRVGDPLPRGAAPLLAAYVARRARIGLPTSAEATLVTTDGGEPIAASELEEYLQRARRQRVSMTFNALMCRGLLETRYGVTTHPENVP
jgi:metal-sulfur cluster biosynthetic enzyme